MAAYYLWNNDQWMEVQDNYQTSGGSKGKTRSLVLAISYPQLLGLQDVKDVVAIEAITYIPPRLILS